MSEDIQKKIEDAMSKPQPKTDLFRMAGVISARDACPHCGTSHKPIVQKFQGKMKHKYSVGDKVTLTIEAEVTEQMPFSFVEPGYTVRIGKVELAVSERSLEKSEDMDENATG